MNRMNSDDIDPVRALREVPPLIKAYLRTGGFVGEGAWVDHDFNTIDVCVVMDTTRMTEKYRRYYEGRRERVR
jgi:putative hemolysin